MQGENNGIRHVNRALFLNDYMVMLTSEPVGSNASCPILWS